MEFQTCDYQLYWGFLTHMESMQAHPEASMTLNHDIAGMANKLVIGGETRSKGIELGAGARLPHGFYTSTNFTYQEAKFEELISMGVDYSGNKLTGVPDTIFAFTLGYLNKRFGDISLKPVYTGKRYFNYANTNEDDGFWVLNARYSKKIGRAEFYLVANNLFDESAVGDGSGNLGSETLYPIAGFNTVFGLNVEF